MLLKEIFANPHTITELFDSRSTTNHPWSGPTTNGGLLVYSRELTDSKDVRYNVYLNFLNHTPRAGRPHGDITIVDISFGVILPDNTESDEVTGNFNAAEVIGMVLNESLEKIKSLEKLPDIISFTVKPVKDSTGALSKETNGRQKAYTTAFKYLFPSLGYKNLFGPFMDEDMMTTMFGLPNVTPEIATFFARRIGKR